MSINHILKKEIECLKIFPEISGIFCDLDGTLSKIAPTPEQAVVTDDMRVVLGDLCRKYAVVAVVTGRDIDNAKQLVALDGIDESYMPIYVGNHGLEILENNLRYSPPEVSHVPNTVDKLANEIINEMANKFDIIGDAPGILVERKKFSIAIHYRLASDKTKAKNLINQLVKPFQSKYYFRIENGRNVVELKPNVSYNKGSAVRDIINKKEIKYAIYVGDDTTDLDAFEVLNAMREEGVRALNIAVLSDEIDEEVRKNADIIVNGVDEVFEVLQWLAI